MPETTTRSQNSSKSENDERRKLKQVHRPSAMRMFCPRIDDGLDSLPMDAKTVWLSSAQNVSESQMREPDGHGLPAHVVSLG